MRSPSPAPSTGQARSWGQVLERTLLTAAAFWLGVQSLTPLAAVAGAGSAAVPGLLVAGGGNLALCALCAYGVRRGLRPSLQRVGLALGWLDIVGGATVAWSGAEGLTRAAELIIPSNAIQALQVFVIAAGVRVRTAIWTIVATGPAFVLLRLPSGVTGETLEQWTVPTSATIALAALVGYLRRGSSYAAQLDEWNHAARTEAAAASVHAQARDEARRVIHDDVITALRGLAQRLPDSVTLPACRGALASLSAQRECTSREELLQRLGAEGAVSVEVSDGGWPMEPPVPVLDAIAGAAGEALRNVARHSGVDRATVSTRVDEGVLVLEVADQGRGLGAQRDAGFGIGESIVRRIRTVGGDAVVVDGEAGGTSVVLTWPLPAPPPAEQVTPFSADERWRGYLPVALAITLNSLFLALRHLGPHPVPSLALALLLTVLVPAVALWFARHPSRPWQALPVTGLTVLLTWAGLSLAGPGALLDFRGWVVGFAAAIPMLFAFDAPLRVVVVPVLAQSGLCVAMAAQDPTIAALEPFGAITTPVVVCGFSALFGALLRRGARAVRQAEATRAARLEEQAWARAREDARRVHLETLRDEVSPFLEQAGAGRPADPVEAEVLAARCRDALHLDRPLPDRVRRAVDEARSRGVSVSFRAGGSSWSDTLAEALVLVLGTHRCDVVTVLLGDDPRVVVLPALRPKDRRELDVRLPAGAHVQQDEVRAVVTVSPDRTTATPRLQPVALDG